MREVPGVEKWTFPAPPHQAHVKSIAFDPRDPSVIHVAVEVGGFLKSTDGGKSWTTYANINPDAHRQFDEATAILAGDALQALAFEVLCTDEHIATRPERQIRVIRWLAARSPDYS